MIIHGQERVHVPTRALPVVTVPTLAATGSEMNCGAVITNEATSEKSFIQNPCLYPYAAVVDPELTLTVPKDQTAYGVTDLMTHVTEGYFNGVDGAPIQDRFAEGVILTAMEWGPKAIAHPDDVEARTQMILAATMAGIGFGSAGVTLPHGMSYPISGNVRSFVPEGYPADHPIIPHGMAVTMTAPAAFRFMSAAAPERCLRAAQLIGLDTKDVALDDAGELLAQGIAKLLRDTGMPNGLSAVGYTPDDVDKLVEGVLPQHRVTKLSPRPATAGDFRQMFLDSMTNW